MKRIDQRGVRPSLLVYDLQGRAGNVTLEHQYHKPGPQPGPDPEPGPTPPGPPCPCNVFSKCDKYYSGMTETQKNVWRKAVKKRGISGYTLWMKEAMTALMRDGRLPCEPSPSGGFACHELKLYNEPPPDWKCTIGAAPPPPPPPPPGFEWFDDFNRPNGPLGPDWFIRYGPWEIFDQSAMVDSYYFCTAYWDKYLPFTTFDIKAHLATYASRFSGFIVSNAWLTYHYLVYGKGNLIWVGWLDGSEYHFLGGWSTIPGIHWHSVCLRFTPTHFMWSIYWIDHWVPFHSWPWVTPPTPDDLRVAGIWGARGTSGYYPDIDDFHVKFPHFDI